MWVLMHMFEIGEEEWGVPYAVYTNLEDAQAAEKFLNDNMPEYDEFDRGQYWNAMEVELNTTGEEILASIESE